MTSLPPALLLLALSSSPPAVAAYRAGIVTVPDLDQWREYRRLSTGASPAKASDQADVEDLVVLRVLAARFHELGLEQEPSYPARLELLELRLADGLLRQRLLDEARPSPQEVREAAAADPHRFDEPRRFRLEDIFKRLPHGATPQVRAAARQAAEAARRQVASGASFAEVAQRESDSSTRLRGGDLGFATLDRLHPAVAPVVAGLKPGGLSPVIETPDGFWVLRCTQVLEPRTLGEAELRERFEQEIRRRRFRGATQALEQELLERLQPEYAAGAAAGAPGTVVAVSFRLASGPRQLTWPEIDVFLEPGSRPSDPAALQARLRERVLLEGRAAEAARRGLTSGEPCASLRRFKTLELQAQRAANVLGERLLEEPDEAELQAAFERQAPVHPARWKLRALVLPLEQGRPRPAYDRFRALAEQAARGELSFEALRRELAPPADERDLGWLREADVWMLGLNLDHAVHALRPGQISPAVQEGPALFVVELADKEDERRASFGEAREGLRAALLQAQRRRAGQRLRREIVAEQQIRLAR